MEISFRFFSVHDKLDSPLSPGKDDIPILEPVTLFGGVNQYQSKIHQRTYSLRGRPGRKRYPMESKGPERKILVGKDFIQIFPISSKRDFEVLGSIHIKTTDDGKPLVSVDLATNLPGRTERMA